jgi:hypothetical protein
MNKQPSSPYLIPLIFLALSTPFFVAAMGVTYSVVSFIRDSEKADGRIAQILAATGDLRLGKRELTSVEVPVDTYGEYYPMVEYSCGGQLGRFRQNEKFNFPPEIGALVPLRISRSDCSDARVDNFMTLWFLPALLFAISSPMVLIGLFLLRSSIRKKRLISELPDRGRRIECCNLRLEIDPYTTENGMNPQQITARFDVDGQEYIALGPSMWEPQPLPESVTILYHPDDPDICMILDDEN